MLFVLLLLLACSDYKDGLTNTPMAAYLNVDKRVELEQQARSGDAEAAHMVVDHYFYSVRNGEEAVKWLEVAIRDGDTEARVWLADILTGNSRIYQLTPESCARGRDLLQQAKDDRDKAAAKMLSDLTPDCKHRHLAESMNFNVNELATRPIALALAEMIFEHVYGKKNVEARMPLHISDEGDRWTVASTNGPSDKTLKPGLIADVPFEVVILKANCKVVRISPGSL